MPSCIITVETQLQSVASQTSLFCILQAVAAYLQEPEGAPSEAAEGAPPATLVVAPDACLQHHTCPEPLTRATPDVPPENVQRLLVLTDPGWPWSFT